MWKFTKYKSCFKKIGYESEITNKKNRILNTDFLILPGVGAFGNAMKLLRQNDLVNVLNEFVLNKKRLLGICLGMQILLSKSYEMGVHKGLNFIEGEVVSFKKRSLNQKLKKIPHISWNEIYLNDKFNNKELNFDFLYTKYYFVHSFLASTKK